MHFACMQIMDREEQLVSAVHWLDINLTFDLDARVHVFELTIRALGGCCSSSSLACFLTAAYYDSLGCAPKDVFVNSASRIQPCIPFAIPGTTSDGRVLLNLGVPAPYHAGSLLSTHILLNSNPVIMPEYNGCLLRLAAELGDRLLPAFDTPHGVPLSWVNLKKVCHCLPSVREDSDNT